MAQQKAFIGIDFGTSNSSIAYVLSDPRDDTRQKVDVKSVPVIADEESGAKSERMPTVLAKPLDNRRKSSSLLVNRNKG